MGQKPSVVLLSKLEKDVQKQACTEKSHFGGTIFGEMAPPAASWLLFLKGVLEWVSLLYTVPGSLLNNLDMWPTVPL